MRDDKGRFIKGHKLGFKGQYTPWNKGKKGIVKWSIESREKLSKTKKGKPSLLKGRKRILTDEWKKNISKGTKGKILSIETRKKISKGLSGSKSYLWEGGKTKEIEKLRKSIEYKEWRKAVFERDNYTCIWGGREHGNKLNADHIKPFALYPDLRFELSNGRTLCIDCHKKTDTYLVRARYNIL